jgi:arsenate-mycothiol transferase
VQVLDEVGVDITGEAPKAIDPALLRSIDLVITLGRDAHLEVPDGVAVRNWDTDEPSQRGIDGLERMRLVRDDITKHVDALAAELQTGTL